MYFIGFKIRFWNRLLNNSNNRGPNQHPLKLFIIWMTQFKIPIVRRKYPQNIQQLLYEPGPEEKIETFQASSIQLGTNKKTWKTLIINHDGGCFEVQEWLSIRCKTLLIRA